MKSIPTICLCILIFVTVNSFSQTPFTTLVKEPIYLQKDEGNKYSESTKQAFDAKTVFNNKTVAKADTDTIDFFQNNSLGVNLLSHGDARFGVSSKVIHYKFYFANPTVTNTSRTFHWNIPLLLISRFSSNYDSINSAAALDLVDYQATPVTLRIMPSWKLSKNKNFTDKLFAGFYADLRGLNLRNSLNTGYDLKLCGAGGLGFTYQGDGSVGTYNEKGEREPGIYSVSAMFQTAIGDKDVIQRLFQTNDNYIMSFQSYIVFYTKVKSRFNFKLGYQYFFRPTITGNWSTFSFAVGI